MDTFARTVNNGWGTANVGGVWSLTGTASAFSVSGGTGSIRHAAAGSQVTATMGAVSSSDTDLTFGFNVDKLTAGYYLTATGRRISAGNEYRARVLVTSANKVTVLLTRLVGGVQTSISTDRSVTGLTYTAGMPLRMRLQVTGTSPTTVRAKVWPAPGTEPPDWLVSATDSTAGLQGPGAIALTSYLSSNATNAPAVARISDLAARPTAPPPNAPPTARFSSSCTDLSCGFDATASSDAEGGVSYAWTFGDGGTASGAQPSHTFAAAGAYDVKLTVTDAGGLTDSVTHQVVVTASPLNQPPTARFTSSCTGLGCGFDATTSSDPEGAVSYAWTFGDGGTASGAQPSHTFAATGAYDVKLTVTDVGGLTDSVTHQVSVTAPPLNQPPTARFTSSCTGLGCGFDATTSSDPEGAVSYAWTFGDGGTASGAQPSHTFAATGAYDVKLTVTDAGGLTDSVTHQVSVTAPAGLPWRWTPSHAR